jgi:hypothetical protein
MSIFMRAGVLALALSVSLTSAAGAATTATYPPDAPPKSGVEFDEPTDTVTSIGSTVTELTIPINSGPSTYQACCLQPSTLVLNKVWIFDTDANINVVFNLAPQSSPRPPVSVQLPDTMSDSRGRYTSPVSFAFTKRGYYGWSATAGGVTRTVIFLVSDLTPQSGVSVVPASGAGASTAGIVRASVTRAVSTSLVSQKVNRPVALTVRGFTPATLVTQRLIMPDGTSLRLLPARTNSRGIVTLRSLKFSKPGRYVIKVKVGTLTRTVNIQIRR